MDFESFWKYLKINNELNYNLLDVKNIYYKGYFSYRIKAAFDSYSKESNEANKIWFNNRLDTFMKKNKNITNRAGILGEFQIYGLLSNSSFKYWLKCMKTNENATPDFIYETTVDGKKLKLILKWLRH